MHTDLQTIKFIGVGKEEKDYYYGKFEEVKWDGKKTWVIAYFNILTGRQYCRPVELYCRPVKQVTAGGKRPYSTRPITINQKKNLKKIYIFCT